MEKNTAKRAAVDAWFDARIAECRQREQQQKQDLRADEAIFTRIENNIYQVFKTVFAAAIKVHGDDDAAVGDFFKQKLITIPATWHETVVKAVQHGDLEAAHVETRKIAAADDIKAAFYRIWETEA